jgi:putative ABC transport system substrate-binding protein
MFQRSGADMKRREFIKLFGGAAAWPLSSLAQQAMPVVGYLSSSSEAQVLPQLNAFRRGLGETGFAEGRNVEIVYHWAEGQYQRLPAMAAELVQRKVSLILAQAPPAALSAKAATTSIPIVFFVGFDPVGAGLVADLNRPGGNATGMTLISHVLAQKRLELVRDLSPKATTVAMLVNPVSPDTAVEIRSVQSVAQTLGLELAMFNATTPAEIDAAFNHIFERRPDALLIGTDAFFLNQRTQIIGRASQLRVPTIYPFRDYAAEGGFLSYGTNIANSYRQAGIYAGRILKGANPAELPVMQPTTFELVINLKAASALNIDIPATVQARSDEVIE